MGIFTRMRDIISANLNAMLDRAEDPEKMVRMMIQEMEDTLIEVKASCAGVMATQKKLERELGDSRREVAEWARKAGVAVDRDRDDLARAALAEKQRYEKRERGIEEELDRVRKSVSDFHEDIRALEDKLTDAREKQRSLIARRQAALARRDAQGRIRGVDTSEVFARFEAYEQGIERLEAQAGLVDGLRSKKPTLRDELDSLEHQEEIEQELQKIKQQRAQSGS